MIKKLQVGSEITVDILEDGVTITTSNPDAIGFKVDDFTTIPFKSNVDGVKTSFIGGHLDELKVELAFPVMVEPTEEPQP